MASTERLYAQLDETANELSDIGDRARKLTADIESLIRAFAADHSCSDKSVNYAIEYTTDALVDLIDDATGPAYRRKTRLEDEIGAIEDADLRRSAPMVL
jgi:molecular chaperone GrpE (heat shock protein)